MKKILLTTFLFAVFISPLFAQQHMTGVRNGFHAFSNTLVVGAEGGFTLANTDYTDAKPYVMGKAYLDYYFPSEWSGSFGLRGFISGGYFGGELDQGQYPEYPPGHRTPFRSYGGGAVFTFMLSESLWPYVFGGMSYNDFSVENTDGSPFSPAEVEGTTMDLTFDNTSWDYNVNVGLRMLLAHAVAFNLDVGLRYTDQDYWDAWPAAGNNDYGFSITGGFSYSFGADRDSDGDWVEDEDDMCPDTPLNVRVDEFGCPVDSDKDGVADYLDKCPNTAEGTKVNEQGCAVDDDNDGVINAEDMCPNTPAGERVNRFGCPDTDNDGVADNLDKCPDTPSGAPVTAEGCPKDSDGDNVPDYKDKCPNTTPGLEVDENGCVVMKEEVAHVVLQGDANFAYNKATLLEPAKSLLDNMVDIMRKYKDARFRVAGHTDSRGSDEYNMKLSRERAQSVVDYLVDQGIDRSRLDVKAFGETKPIAPNDSPEDRAMNRRVEIHLIEGSLNPGRMNNQRMNNMQNMHNQMQNNNQDKGTDKNNEENNDQNNN